MPPRNPKKLGDKMAKPGEFLTVSIPVYANLLESKRRADEAAARLQIEVAKHSPTPFVSPLLSNVRSIEFTAPYDNKIDFRAAMYFGLSWLRPISPRPIRDDL